MGVRAFQATGSGITDYRRGAAVKAEALRPPSMIGASSVNKPPRFKLELLTPRGKGHGVNEWEPCRGETAIR